MRVGLGAASALLALLVASPLAADAASAARDAERAKVGPRMAGQHPAYLPDASCGFVDTAADDAAHAFQPAGTPVIKVVYAHPADAPNEAAAYYPRLAQAVRDAMEYVYLESSDRKSIGFDLGTAEGPDCVDVQRVSLPGRPYDVPPGGTLSSIACATTSPGCSARSPRRATSSSTPLDPQPPGGRARGDPERRLAVGRRLPAGGSSRSCQLLRDRGGRPARRAGGGPRALPQPRGHPGERAEQRRRRSLHRRQRPDVLRGRALHCARPPDDLDCAAPRLRPRRLLQPRSARRLDLAMHWNTYNSPFLCEIGACAPDNLGPLVEIKGKRRTSDRTPRSGSLPTRMPSASGAGSTPHLSVAAAGGSLRQLEPGRHLLRALARDGAGNASPKAARFRFRVRG